MFIKGLLRENINYANEQRERLKMLELSIFLAFCLTLVAIVAMASQNDDMAKLAVSKLGELAKGFMPTAVQSVDDMESESDP